MTSRGRPPAALEPAKLEIQRQWDIDPCGAESVGARSGLDDRAFYRAVRDHRYNVYAPWFDERVGFDDWHGKDILEVGVGLGSDHVRLGRGGNRMTALDLSREHLRHTLRHMRSEDLTTRPVYGDAERMAFRNSSFDLVYAFGVLHHTPNIQSAVAEIYRVLRPGGRVVAGLYHRNSLFFASVVMKNGILKGRFATRGWDGVLADIEYRHDRTSATPPVRVYSRRQVQSIFGQFDELTVSTCHVESLGPLQSVLRLPRHRLEGLFGRLGWYLIVSGIKPLSATDPAQTA